MVSKPKLGIIVQSLYLNQMALEITEQLNKLDGDFTVFVQEYEPISIPNKFAVMDLSYIWNYSGPVLATNLVNAEILIKAKIPGQKGFYIYELEWLNNHKFMHNVSIYSHQDFFLFTRSKKYADAVENYANVRPKVVENFNISKILDEYRIYN